MTISEAAEILDRVFDTCAYIEISTSLENRAFFIEKMSNFLQSIIFLKLNKKKALNSMALQKNTGRTLSSKWGYSWMETAFPLLLVSTAATLMNRLRLNP